MATFPLKIVCPDGLKFQGQVIQLNVRTSTGEMGILAHHANCVAPLGMGCATVITENGRRNAACIGGMVSVMDGGATVVCTTFEWADEIDLPRVERSMERAQNVLNDQHSADTDIRMAEARLRRALIRKSVATRK